MIVAAYAVVLVIALLMVIFSVRVPSGWRS
jgi:hypothetical protein